MTWKSKELERILEGPCDPTRYLFEYVAPLLDVFLQTGKVVSLECAVAREARSQGVTISTLLEERRDTAVKELNLYLKESMPHMYKAALFFSHYQKPARDPQYDNHCFSTYGEYMAAVAKHATNLQKYGNGFSDDTLNTLGKTAEFDYRKRGMRLDKEVHLGFRHGSSSLDTNVNYPVIFQISRIKNPNRFGTKCARFLCEGIQELSSFQKALEDSRARQNFHGLEKIPSRIRQTLGGMHYLGLSTPFSTNNTLDPMEYLFVRSRVSDLCGVFDVTRTEQEARMLLNKLLASQFSAAKDYEVLQGYRLQKNKVWEFEYGPLIDDHYLTGSRELSAETARVNQNIFLYIVPKHRKINFDLRIDFGVSHLAGYYQDLPPNEGSHVLYEAKQEMKVMDWPKQDRALYQRLCFEIEAITSRLNIQKYELYPENIFPKQIN